MRPLHRAVLALGLLLAPALPAAAQVPQAAPQYQVDPFWPKPLPRRLASRRTAGTMSGSSNARAP
jgi:hypothetical protein